MKVSAIIPTYDRRDYVCRAIASVLEQSTPVDELLIVDDGSTDGTPELVESRYGSQVRVIRQENRGVSGARLRGIQEAQGEWIAFLDSDDEWLPGRQYALTSAASGVSAEVAWLFGDMQVRTDNGVDTSLFAQYGLSVKGHPQTFADSLRTQFPFQFSMFQCSLIRRQVLLDCGCFQAGFRSDEDVLVGFQVACRYKFAAIATAVTVLNRTSDLLTTSLLHNNLCGPDRHRARMMAFSLAADYTRKAELWVNEYEHAVRGLCRHPSTSSTEVRKLSFQQFRYRAASKSLAFFPFALCGRSGMNAWNRLGEFLRGRKRHNRAVDQCLAPAKQGTF